MALVYNQGGYQEWGWEGGGWDRRMVPPSPPQELERMVRSALKPETETSVMETGLGRPEMSFMGENINHPYIGRLFGKCPRVQRCEEK